MNDRDFYGLFEARSQAMFSRDPSTKVGAAILRADGSVSGVGRNGFPKGIGDHAERMADREWKLACTIHAEENAMGFAAEDVSGMTIYVWPWAPCAPCAARIIQRGIRRVVTIDRPLPDRWTVSMERAATILAEAGVVLDVLPEEEHRLRRDSLPSP